MTKFSGIHQINVFFSKKFDYWDKTISKDDTQFTGSSRSKSQWLNEYSKKKDKNSKMWKLLFERNVIRSTLYNQFYPNP